MGPIGIGPVSPGSKPKFAKRGTWPQTASQGICIRTVRGFGRTERVHMLHSEASGTMARSVKIGLDAKDGTGHQL